MVVVEHHQHIEHLYILAGTLVDQHRASGPDLHFEPGMSTHALHLMDARSEVVLGDCPGGS